MLQGPTSIKGIRQIKERYTQKHLKNPKEALITLLSIVILTLSLEDFKETPHWSFLHQNPSSVLLADIEDVGSVGRTTYWWFQASSVWHRLWERHTWNRCSIAAKVFCLSNGSQFFKPNGRVDSSPCCNCGRADQAKRGAEGEKWQCPTQDRE